MSTPRGFPTHREFALFHLSPLVAIAASQDVNDALSANGIYSFSDFLQPFGEHIELSVGVGSRFNGDLGPSSVGSAGGGGSGEASGAHNDDSFHLRFRDISDLTNVGIQDGSGLPRISAAVGESIRAHSTLSMSKLQNGSESKADATQRIVELAAKDIDEATPWFSDYRNYICSLIRASEHETFNHPVACVYQTWSL